MLKKIYRYFSLVLNRQRAKRVLGKFLKQKRLGSNFVYSPNIRMGCIVDLEKFPEYEKLFSIPHLLNANRNNFSIIGFSTKNSAEDTSDVECGMPLLQQHIFVFDKNVKSQTVKDFFSREYDLLINYFDEEKSQLLLLSIATRAKLRAGFPSIPFNYNDLIVTATLSEFELFMSETLKYITLINTKR